LVVSGTGALDPANLQFQLDEIPVIYRGTSPTRPSYLRPDSAMLDGSELAADYDYVFYDQAHLVQPVQGATCFGEIKRALFNRDWDHFTSHQHAPVGDSLGSPIAVQKDQILYFAVPLFGGYRNWDYWAYRALAIKQLRNFLPPALVIAHAPGWVEVSLHHQPRTENNPERKIVHIVSYHPRRSSQAIPHVDQSWQMAGLSIKVRLDDERPARTYLAPDQRELPFSIEGRYVNINLPPVGAHAVLVLENE